MKNHKGKPILVLSLLLSLLVIPVSCIGLFTPHFYSQETINWQAQSTGQDMVDLYLIIPVLLVTAVAAYKGNNSAKLIWGGVVLYLTYTFVLYCFDLHFNSLFIAYCAGLGLSFYSVIYFLFSEHEAIYTEPGPLVRFIGFYFISIAILFYLLWLMEVIPAIVQGNIPKSVSDAGLLTNGVHAIDLSIFLPGTFITGLFLLKRKPLGFTLTPALLTFFILMDITIGVLALVMKEKGIESNSLLVLFMAIAALMSLILLILFFKSAKAKSAYKQQT